jgi:TldD protein
MSDLRRKLPLELFAIIPLLGLCGMRVAAQQPGTEQNPPAAPAPVSALPPLSAAAAGDPVIKAMYEELQRSKAKLKMEGVAAPYYIEYRLGDIASYEAEAAFGSLRSSQRTHLRSLRVVVRVGGFKQDSYYGAGMGVADLGPLDDDPVALRHQFWLATDRAYKAAVEALTAKQALLRDYTAGQPFDDFAQEPAVQSIGELKTLDFDPEAWDAALERATALFRTDPKIESLTASLRFNAVNQYFLNTEGTAIRHGRTVFFLALGGTTQADDGMKLERSPDFCSATLRELPSPERLQTEAQEMIATLKALREASVVEEDYRGPVLFSPDSAGDVFHGMIGENVLGRRPRPGESARTVGQFASSYKTKVLPEFISMVDDPTRATFGGKTLAGSYEFDDEGVAAAAVPVIENGQLVNYLLGRQPIRDFPQSNGHGRAAPGQEPAPAMGNLFVESKEAFSPDDLKKKLIEMCSQQGIPYGYYVETLGPGYKPLLLYRVYLDGHQELVRGAVFNELDTRALRSDLVAVGNDPQALNRNGPVPTSIVAPSILFDDLEVKRTDEKNAKLPEYPPPDLTTSR